MCVFDDPEFRFLLRCHIANDYTVADFLASAVELAAYGEDWAVRFCARAGVVSAIDPDELAIRLSLEVSSDDE